MKKKIFEIATELSKGKLTTKEAKGELLFLFGVVGQSEQLPCDHKSYAYTLNNDWKLCDDCGKEFK